MKIDSSLSSVSSPSPSPLQKVSQGLEALFVEHMISAMRKTVPENELWGKSQAEKIYQSLLDAEYAQKMAQTEQLGISTLIYQFFMRQK